MQTDIVLINPGCRTEIYQDLGEKLTAVEPPVWAGLMASFLRGKGFQVGLIDAEAEDLTPAQVDERVESINPRLVAIVIYGHQPSASTQNMTGASRTATALKESNTSRPVLMVGGHVAALPERTLREEKVDFVARGEGLMTMAGLLPLLREGGSDYSKVPGLWYREGSAFQSTAEVPLIKGLDDEIPMIAWDLMPMDRYRAHNWHCLGHTDRRQPYAAIYTTLGCPYHCSFCCIQAPFKAGEQAGGFKEGSNSYRFWSVKSVVDQIEHLVTKYGVYNIKIADEMFVLTPRHVLGICDGIIERGLKVNIWAYARVDTVKDNMLEKLKAAGINWLAFGIEAANARVRDAVQKGFDQEDIARTLTKVRQAGISVIGNYIFGLPEDDLDTMQQTLDLASDLNCEFGNFYCAMAYPGSQLYEMAIREGWELPSTWSGYSQHAYDSFPLRTKHLTSGQVLKFRDEAFHRYYSNPRYLEMIRTRYDQPTVDHLVEMTKHRLKRKYAA